MHSTIPTMAHLPRQLATMVEHAGEAALDRAPEGAWPARTILAHLRDEEAYVFRLRVERMLGEDEPEFTPYPPEVWLAERQTDRDGTRDLLRDFALQRQASVNLLERVSETDQHRRGHHPVHGRFTIASWVDYWSKHDREHYFQLERVLHGQP